MKVLSYLYKLQVHDELLKKLDNNLFLWIMYITKYTKHRTQLSNSNKNFLKFSINKHQTNMPQFHCPDRSLLPARQYPAVMLKV